MCIHQQSAKAQYSNLYLSLSPVQSRGMNDELDGAQGIVWCSRIYINRFIWRFKNNKILSYIHKNQYVKLVLFLVFFWHKHTNIEKIYFLTQVENKYYWYFKCGYFSSSFLIYIIYSYYVSLTPNNVFYCMRFIIFSTAKQ
jgi:hypothetical protein